MTASIKLVGAGLEVPHFVQRERSAGSWTATLLTAATSRLRRESRVLLRDISFEAVEGDRVALLGRNGAGKTTLLRLLAGSLQPTSGRVEIQGSRQALLNLGLGFNAEATVRENIYLRGTAMGLRPSQIRDLVEPILEFADLADVANHRLATLSSGQRMRLGFSVSTSVQHDIMLLDEWFGAGDAEFVEKARARMTSRVDGSKVVILASHNFKMLRQVCNRGIVVDHGRVAFDGSVDDAVEAYKNIYQSTPEYQAYRLAQQAAAEQAPGHQARQKLTETRRALREQKRALREQRDKLRTERVNLREARRRLREQAAKVKALRAGSAGAAPDGGGSSS